MTEEVQELAANCLQHLGREEKLLSDLQEVAESVRESILAKDPVRLETLVDRHHSFSDQLNELSDERQALRRRMAQVLGVAPKGATLTALLEHCDDTARTALGGFQNRLQTRGKSLNGLLTANSSLTLQLLELFDNVFRSLSGDQIRSPSYGPTGRPTVV